MRVNRAAFCSLELVRGDHGATPVLGEGAYCSLGVRGKMPNPPHRTGPGPRAGGLRPGHLSPWSSSHPLSPSQSQSRHSAAKDKHLTWLWRGRCNLVDCGILSANTEKEHVSGLQTEVESGNGEGVGHEVRAVFLSHAQPSTRWVATQGQP